jgi:hypothetical protein
LCRRSSRGGSTIPSDELSRFFANSQASLRRLVLLLYAIVGPVFAGILFVTAHQRSGFDAVVALILAGGLWLALRREPKVYDWIFCLSIAPTACCGIAFSACQPVGTAVLVVVRAPLSWGAVLFEAPVVVCA